MFLKRLDVMGFKSFAERISIDFVEGVTAVVGPNGSGKSNVTDAIRWVLGEQSAKSLRGAKMEDIIFAGSDSRKSLNFAEVTLTLNNENQFLPLDYQEVSVTRRVFRSGESEFFINKQNCRLKDIVDLFMDSGLGREAFSIISQGKVEEILSSKAEERRTIFEEAAGVLKYKTRKKKAEQKLIETRDNLNRVQDILHELEGQVEPLKIQASMAKDYLQKKEELQQYEVALTVHEIEVLHGKWQELSKQNEEHSNQELKMSSELQQKEAMIEQLRDRITAIDESVSDLQDVLIITTQDLEKLEGRRSVLQERKKNATQSKQQLEQTIEEAQKHIKQLQMEQTIQLQKLEEIQATVKELKQQLGEKEMSLASFSEDLELEIESLKGDYIDLLNKQAAANNEMRMVQQQLEQINARSLKLDSENEDLLSKRTSITSEKETLIYRLQSIKDRIEETAGQLFERKTSLDKLQDKYKNEETKLYQAYQYVQQVQSRIEMLKGMEDEYAGFFQGVKEVLKAPNLQGVEGAVAELISVPREYNLAIETALGAAMQHVVVDTEENARKAIQFLKINSFGRATFLPMTVMKERNIASAQLQLVMHHPSFIGVASQLVRYDAKYAAIVANLLGTVIITSDLKGANELAQKLHYKYRIVTLEGDVVNPGGSMTGGATKGKNYSLLSRKGELEELTGKLPQMEEKTEQLEKQVKQLKESIQQHNHSYEQLRIDSEQLRIQEESVKGELREVETNERNINDRLALYDLDQSSYIEEKLQREQRLTELERLLSEFAKQLEESKAKIEELTNRKQAQQSSISAVTTELNDLKIQFAAKKEQQQHVQETYDRLLKDLEDWQRKEKDASEDRELLFSDMESNTSGEQQIEELAKTKLQDKNETIKLIAARREERNHLHLRLEDEERELKELKRVYKGYVETMKDEEVKINRLDVELENRLQHLQQEYLLSFEDAKEQFTLQDSPEETTKKVKLIKMAIEDLGTINLGAIDEYERVYERFTFLTEQRADLQEAKETLFQVIDEMDEEMKRRFKETFDGIRNEFEAVFQQLFGGGRAELKLTNPDDLLNTGVEIIAQPPGKKLQNLGLLSGGERALTAIALLFSILIVRPVPFCVLDEVEAALDEANVHRFSQYLKKFSSQTQFIVITHRKGTMESADVLYGITMQESGVSKLVSVRLEDKNLAEQTK